MFVIQGKEKPWKNTYKTLDYLPRYKTIEEAREDFKKIPKDFQLCTASRKNIP